MVVPSLFNTCAALAITFPASPPSPLKLATTRRGERESDLYFNLYMHALFRSMLRPSPPGLPCPPSARHSQRKEQANPASGGHAQLQPARKSVERTLSSRSLLRLAAVSEELNGHGADDAEARKETRPSARTNSTPSTTESKPRRPACG